MPDDYEAAYKEWADSGEAALWEATVGDGLEPEPIKPEDRAMGRIPEDADLCRECGGSGRVRGRPHLKCVECGGSGVA